MEDDPYEGITLEFINSLRTSGLANHGIKLKVGAAIMLLKIWINLKDCKMKAD